MQQQSVKVLIADDHELIRGGLRQVLQLEAAFEVFEAADGEAALAHIRQKKPDIAVLDIEMPGITGFEVARRVQSEGLPTHVIILTMYRDESMFNRALDVGIKGYVLKENTVGEIVKGIKTVLDGGYYISPVLSDLLMQRHYPSGENSKSELEKLTPTEKGVLEELAAMKTNQEIADSMHVSIKTIQNHRSNICSKLGLQGAHALLRYATEHIKK
ncbi:MAG: two-component signal transduction system LuxR family response regulator [Bacteroidetes bacterium HLUCCA01]|nr:MAG: two-component signal transduction system LuxR family response regulator [Bacteroidetes bacterium HLUCCA01]